jgi:multisubunit Na+/H+ antiporter MnhF subunit
MSDWAAAAIQIALGVMVALLLPCVYRVIAGPRPADRLQAIETITTLLIGIVILLALVQNTAFVVDIGIALAAFSFVGTLAIARYVGERRMF